MWKILVFDYGPTASFVLYKKWIGKTVKKLDIFFPSSCDVGVTELPAPELEILSQISKVALRIERTRLLEVIILRAYPFPS